MSEWFILIFVLTFIYLIMKKPKATAETPVTKTKAKTEQPKAEATKAKAKVEPPKTAVVTKAAPKKTNPEPKAPKKVEAPTSKPAAAKPEMNESERVGLTAGTIWHYLAENGATSVVKLVRELSEDEKTIQRSIGWLAQEGKITLETIGRVETVALK